MSQQITDRDIATHVRRTLGEDHTGYDIDAITRSLIDTYGQIDPNTLDNDEYWAIVAAHEYPPAPDPAEEFEARLYVLADAQPAPQTLTWEGEHATVTISTGGYIQRRPSAVTRITITTPDGEQTHLTGEDGLSTWGDLWARVDEIGQGWVTRVGHATAHAVAAQRAVDHAEAALSQTRVRRDRAVRVLRAEGVTAYRIAKILGISEKHVGRLVAGA